MGKDVHSQSPYLTLLYNLEITSAYTVLLSKIKLLTDMTKYSKQIRLKQFKEAAENGTVLSTPIERSFNHDIYPILVYVPEDENSKKKFVENLIRIEEPKGAWISNAGEYTVEEAALYEKLKNIDMVTHQWFESKYDELHGKLKEYEPLYKEIQSKYFTLNGLRELKNLKRGKI